MNVLTAAEMRACDRRTVEDFGATWTALMESAGSAVARFAARQFPQAKRIAVLCGKGNNGGDGFVAARHLEAGGRQVQVVLLQAPGQLAGEARVAYEKLPQALKASALVLAPEENLSGAAVGSCFAETELFVDAIFGTGFHPPLGGVVAALRERLAAHPAPVLSVDLPSGWDADSTGIHAEAFRSNAVVTFTAPKLAHVFGALTRGPVVVAPIGSPAQAIVSEANLTWTGAAKKMVEVSRAVEANKGRFGHVLVAGGSVGKAGAPAMASLGAMRAGAGLVTAAIPRGIASTVAGFAPELMTLPLEDSAAGSISWKNLDPARLKNVLQGIRILAVGPGAGREAETAEFIRELIGRTKLPTVLDADGLNAFENRAELLDGRERPLVLTPHPGEMARLIDSSIAEVEHDRVGAARGFATEHHATVVLKGWRTLVAHPDGRVAVNTTGSPALAKGGSGDVLTGIVAAMMAQFPERLAEAVECAVWLHGRAAELYVRARNERTLLAIELLEHLSDAIRSPVEHDGFTWLQEGAQ